jgi:hypothetical protein
MSHPTLVQLQRRFKNDIMNETSECLEMLETSNAFSSARRLDVYRQTIGQIIDFVAADHSILADYFGESDLADLIEKYLRHCPSRFTNKADVSAGFSSFLAENGPKLLAEIARFDWLQVVSAASTELPQGFVPIARATPEDLEPSKIVLDPTLQLFNSDYRVHDDMKNENCFLAIRSLEHAMQVEELSQEQYDILLAILDHRELSEVSLNEADLITIFSNWVKDGTIAGFTK